MKLFATTIIILCVIHFSGCSDKETDDVLSDQDPSLQARIELAKCLTRKGWTMYGSYTCSACVTQKKSFGEEAYRYIEEIECNPHAPHTKVDLCIAKKIRYTPTWIVEAKGQEIMRITEYQSLEDLAKNSGCELRNQ